jgi:hypothetical protein
VADRARVVRFAGSVRSQGRQVDDDGLLRGPSDHDDRAYRSKYGGYPRAYVDPTVTAEATAATLRLSPR